MIFKELPADWQQLIRPEFNKDYFQILETSLQRAYEQSTVFPPKEELFQAFHLCSLQYTKVVLIGQDPYHGPGQAHGLSFSVKYGMKKPPSLQNIFKELKNDIPAFDIPLSGNLEKWAAEGVLLLNAVLSVEQGKPGSHKAFGWEKWTNAIIQQLSEQKEHLVFLLWGNYAISKKEFIDESKHLVLCAAHPSPLARGAFFGSKHFSKTNTYLKQNNLTEINWHLG